MNISLVPLRRSIAPSLALSTLILAGCAAGVPNMAIDESARAEIRTVRVNPVVAMPPGIEYIGQAQGVAALVAGPFEGLVDDKLSAVPKQRLVRAIQDNHIDVPAMLAAAFARHASADASMKFVGADTAADAQVELTVNRYGFATAHPGAATLYPVMSVSAVMKNAKGEVVWQGTDALMQLNPDNKVGRQLDELLNDPEVLRQALASGSDLVSGMLTHNLMGLEKAQNVPGIQK